MPIRAELTWLVLAMPIRAEIIWLVLAMPIRAELTLVGIGYAY